MHALFGTHKGDALPFFEQLLPDFHSLLVSKTPVHDDEDSTSLFSNENMVETEANFCHVVIGANLCAKYGFDLEIRHQIT